MKAIYKAKSSVPGIGGTKVTLTPVSGDFKSGRPDGLLVITLGEGQALNANSEVTIEITVNGQ
jgi:hypothetical protein